MNHGSYAARAAVAKRLSANPSTPPDERAAFAAEAVRLRQAADRLERDAEKFLMTASALCVGYCRGCERVVVPTNRLRNRCPSCGGSVAHSVAATVVR